MLGYRTNSCARHQLLEVAYCEALADSMCHRVLLETRARCSTEGFELPTFRLFMYASMSHFRTFLSLKRGGEDICIFCISSFSDKG